MTTFYKDGKMIVIRVCSKCHVEFMVEHAMSELQYMDAVTNPELIHKIVPNASPVFRKAMTAGLCPECLGIDADKLMTVML